MRTLQSQVAWCRRIQLLLGGFVLASALAFYFLVYRPQTATLKNLAAQTLARQRELTTNRMRARDRNEIAAKNEKLKAELDRIKKPSDQQELPQVISDLTVAGAQSSLRKFNYKTNIPVRSEMVCALPLSLTFEGDFLNVFNFLRSTEDMQRLTRVRSFSLKSRDSKSGQVQAQLTMNVYFSLN